MVNRQDPPDRHAQQDNPKEESTYDLCPFPCETGEGLWQDIFLSRHELSPKWK
jgi:hypothetical protein